MRLREVDGGLETLKLSIPAIITTDLRLNEPRYASLPNIMKAKKKELTEKTAADYGVDVSPRLTVVKTAEPEGRKAGIKVASVDELVAILDDFMADLLVNGCALSRAQGLEVLLKRVGPLPLCV